jgi:glycosyltransferase involved in cell wall biosynthesis
MVKEIYFILPPAAGLASTYVRAQCLKGFAPKGYEFIFINPPSMKIKYGMILKRGFTGLNYLKELAKIKIHSNGSPAVYFIKPTSVLLLLISRYFLRLKTFIDLNDPMHLPEFLGRLSIIKLRLFMAIVNGIIFESLEYRRYCRKWTSKRSTVIEDTPQFEISFINYQLRKPIVVWFGSPSTSKTLLAYANHLMVFSEHGYIALLLGASQEVVTALKEKGITIELVERYDHQILVDSISSAVFSFVPMPNTELFSLRGNLKAKLSMACGCLTIASNLPMHKRLISSRSNGYLFNDLAGLKAILNEISEDVIGRLNQVGKKANLEIVSKYNRSTHAKKLCSFIESCL